MTVATGAATDDWRRARAHTCARTHLPTTLPALCSLPFVITHSDAVRTHNYWSETLHTLNRTHLHTLCKMVHSLQENTLFTKEEP